MLRRALFVLITAAAAGVQAQEGQPPPCSAPEASQFDFWIGDWSITSRIRTGPGDDDFADGVASNSIRKILDGCVIEESFDGGTAAAGFRGRSVSTWVPAMGKWRQTWVDNAGGYLDFTGGMDGNRMILSREAKQGDQIFLQRMVFENITADSLDWNWERSDDGGETWKLLWHLHYTRKTEP